jgi:hypothetical protein
MESEAQEPGRPLGGNKPVQPSSETNCRQEATEELFVPAQESELAPHAPTGLSNPFWSA